MQMPCQEDLNLWFLENKRDFPWRVNPTPYTTFISEMMLQQTQASVVVGYFQKWMQRFPSIESVAEVSLQEVVKHWEGLGYYSRARSIHAAARVFASEYNGTIPSDPNKLKKLKGLGPYTIGAIRCFGHKKKAVAVDSNVLRVLSRFFCIEENISSSQTVRSVQGLTESMLPIDKPWVFMEALIELGALVCKKKPDCMACPLAKSCLALKNRKTEELPKKNPRPEILPLHRLVALVFAKEHILIRKNKEGIMKDLWEFPYIEVEENLPLLCTKKAIEKNLGIKLLHQEMMPPITQHFTRYKAHLYSRIWKAAKTKDIKGYEWIEKSKLNALPFSSGHRRIWRSYETSRRD